MVLLLFGVGRLAPEGGGPGVSRRSPEPLPPLLPSAGSPVEVPGLERWGSGDDGGGGAMRGHPSLTVAPAASQPPAPIPLPGGRARGCAAQPGGGWLLGEGE